jgi:hypothetical protein
MSAVAASSELSVSVAVRRPRLVLDPWLCLEALGPPLIQKLQACAELWLVRELWHILDNSHYFTREPTALLADEAAAPSAHEYRALFASGRALERAPVVEPSPVCAAELRRSLQFWDGLRSSTDLAGLKLFWLGDGLSESLLPEGTPPQLHAHHERILEWLDASLAPRSPVQCAQRDALALALALGDVPILSSAQGAGEGRSMASWLAATQLSVRQIDAPDELLGMEREAWRALLVRANCAPLVWSGLRLTLIHVSGAGALWSNDGEPTAEVAPLCTASFVPPRVFWHAL